MIEYAVHEFDATLSPGELADFLNKLGRDDWQLLLQFRPIQSSKLFGVFSRTSTGSGDHRSGTHTGKSEASANKKQK